MIFIKGFGIWLLMVVVAIVNGLMRDKLLTPTIGSNYSLPLSGAFLSIFVFLVAYFTIAFFGNLSESTYFVIGVFWVTLTLAFEYLFGHYVGGKSWEEINQVFDISKGDLFILVLVVSAVSPWVSAKLKGLI